MPYKIKSLRLKNFKCFDNERYYKFDVDFQANPIILSGPNGFGKTTFFDALELIFRKKITRFNREIEKQNTNIVGNILLNEHAYNGYLIVELINEHKEIFNIIACIDKDNTKINYDSISYTYFNGELKDKDIQNFLEEATFSEALNDKLLNYKKEEFNIFYYLSQGESAHFLKTKLQERRSITDVLLISQEIETEIGIIEKVKGKKTASKGELQNEIEECKRDIEELVLEIKNLNSKDAALSSFFDKKPNYKNIFLKEEVSNIPDWDKEEMNFENLTLDYLEKFKKTINNIYYYSKNIDDYSIYLRNKEVSELIEKNSLIKIYVKLLSMFEDDVISVDKIANTIERNNKKIELYKKSEMLRNDKLLELYSKDCLMKVRGLLPEKIELDVEKVDTQIQLIKKLNNKLSENNLITKELIQARKDLRLIYDKANSESSHCPYCNKGYIDRAELDERFTILDTYITDNSSDTMNDILAATTLLNEEVRECKSYLLEFFADLTDEDIKKLEIDNSDLFSIARDIKHKDEVEQLHMQLLTKNNIKDIIKCSTVDEIKSLIKNLYIEYINIEFCNLSIKYSFEKTHDFIIENNLKISKSFEETDKNNKISYLEYKFKMFNNCERNEKIIGLRELVKKKRSLEISLERLKKIQSIYDAQKNKYRDEIIEKIKIPLLIYTGKILQDYQNGLGVFIQEKDMRFVSDGNYKHDILNTFSSGQLSGFIIAFLLTMNKVYVQESNDDIGFILIDDPVQTMDDINIASLVEVLRNDFKYKQLIISTHEEEKENYMLYKFSKYKSKGQSLNVKTELYNI